MKKSAAHSIEDLAAQNLEFPVSSNFQSRPPRVPWAAIYKRSEESLSWKLRQPDFEKKRLADKVPVEFVL